MFFKLVFITLLVSSAISRNVPRYGNLDEDEQLLFRAAYDTPYGHEEYEEGEVLPIGKLDLLKDGMWAIKAKIKEMKTFNKALAANLLSTKLQVKELLSKHLKTIKMHHHFEIEKKKPAYDYQSPPSPPPQYEPPQYAAPASHYEPTYYTAPVQYEPPHYVTPEPQYEPPHYPVPAQYGSPQYETHQYGPPQYAHDPYYGH